MRTALGTILLLLAATGAQAEDISKRMPRVERGQMINAAPTPAPAPKFDPKVNVGPAEVRPTLNPPGGTVTIPCGPNIQNGRVVCN